jgi:trans-aconitate 2-methyltransferase
MGDDMPTWNAHQYLKFADERIRPCRDLGSRIAVDNPRRVIDLGCGPGNSASVLAERWPNADIAGVDNSDAMIDVARKEQPHRRWIASDIWDWARTEQAQFDLIFSNAALQWVSDHASLYPRLLERVATGGAFAAQIPADFNALPHQLMRELAPPNVRAKEWFSHEPSFYYDVLAPHARVVDIWEAIYQHVLPNADAIVEWYKGSGMRPFLEAMSSNAQREEFMQRYTERIRAAYPVRPDGKVLFPFRRLFVIAYM